MKRSLSGDPISIDPAPKVVVRAAEREREREREGERENAVWR